MSLLAVFTSLAVRGSVVGLYKPTLLYTGFLERMPVLVLPVDKEIR